MRSATPPLRPGSGGSVGALRRAGSREGRQQVGSRAPSNPTLASPEESPRWLEEEPSQPWTPGPLLREEAQDGPEAYALFKPSDVLSGAHSAKLRRLEADVAELRLDDVYGALVPPWELTRRDVNEPHGSLWQEGSTADFWVSTDTGKVCFAPVDLATSSTSPEQAGQYYKEVAQPWRHCGDSDSDVPGNVGGFHCCCVDTTQEASSWMLVAKIADFGLALGRDAGPRVEFAALVRQDCEAILASFGPHDECRSLFLVEEVQLPNGRVLLADPAELRGTGESVIAGDGPTVPSGLGAGYYPVILSRDSAQQICRITVVFHPSRLDKVCRDFPPVQALSSTTTTAKPSTVQPSGRSSSTRRSTDVEELR